MQRLQSFCLYGLIVIQLTYLDERNVKGQEFLQRQQQDAITDQLMRQKTIFARQ